MLLKIASLVSENNVLAFLMRLKALALFFVLQSLLVGAISADTLTLLPAPVIAIDGNPTAATFTLKVDAASSTSRLTTAQLLDISVTLKPDTNNLDRMGSVFAVFVKDDHFFLLRPDRSFTMWNGEVETLLPFLQDFNLTKAGSVHLLSGRLNNPGQYQIFTAYMAEGEALLKFTPDPFILTVHGADNSPELEQATSLYQAEVESRVVQTRCIVCHVEGGVARNSSLKFQRNMTGSALNNLNMLKAYLALNGNSAETVLSRASGGNAHPGGQQLVNGSRDYKVFEQVLTLLDADQAQQSQSIAYTFAPGNIPGSSAVGVHSLLASVQIEPREATLRRATVLFAGRVPTSSEIAAVRSGDENTLRNVLRSLMTGPQFREFVVSATNDRLLTRGADDPINVEFVSFPLLRNLNYETVMAGRDYWQLYGSRLREGLTRASGELIAHVIINELAYSEVLTADYMMMNPMMNEYLGGTASFSANAGDRDFLPSKITQYYFPSEVVRTEERVFFNGVDAGHRVLSTGKPITDYPHAGILTDFAYLTRYPTTATNRNRARARWTLYHFLGIDIEKSSQRPLDEAALSDRNNPTMNNQNCTVCHAVLDPVAGAFQNWSDFNFYRENGHDALDHLYKYPNDGSVSPYRTGDLWYRDMRAPGLFETQLTSRDYTLRELAGLIVKEPGFLKAAVRFWWPALFGETMVVLPAVESDQGFAEKSAAYAAQQASLEQFSSVLGQRMNAKDMLVEMMLSPWFRAESSTRHELRAVQIESNLGAPRLLGPELLVAKTLAVTGVNWRTSTSPSGNTWSAHQEMAVLLGGIDSLSVLERSTVLTPTIFAVQQAMMAEVACPAVAKDFAMPFAKRRMFSRVEPTVTPLLLASSTLDVTSNSRSEMQDIKLSARIPALGAKIDLTFVNPHCDYDGVRCLEQRVLYVQGLSLRRASGLLQQYTVQSPEVSVLGQNCNVNQPGATFYGGCTLSLTLPPGQEHDVEIIARVSAQQAPSQKDPVRANIQVLSTQDILSATTANAQLIKQQIVDLIYRFHGRTVAINSVEVEEVYSLFVVGLETARLSGKTHFDVCHWYLDGNYLTDIFTPEQIRTFRKPDPDNDWWRDDWDILGPLMHPFNLDITGAKRGWVAVVTYLLTHYDYVHE